MDGLMRLSVSEGLIIERIAADYFPDDHRFPVRISYKLEGQALDKEGRFLLGCKAGPTIEASNLLHEMAHFAEREVEALKKRPVGSWGFKFGKLVEIPAVSYSRFEFSGVQHIERELRVFGYHLNLARKYEVGETAKSLAGLCRFLQNFLLYGSSEEASLTIIEKRIEEAAAIYTLEKFEDEWWSRTKLLRI